VIENKPDVPEGGRTVNHSAQSPSCGMVPPPEVIKLR